MKITKKKILLALAVVLVLAAAFWWGGSAPGLRGWSAEPPIAAATPGVTPEQSAPPEQSPTPTPTPTVAPATPMPTATPATPMPTATPAPEKIPAPTKAPAPEKSAETRPGGTQGGLTAEEKLALAAAGEKESPADVAPPSAIYAAQHGMTLDQNTGKDRYRTDPVPEGKPVPVEPESVKMSDKAYTCTLSVSCAAILDSLDWLDPEKVELVPADGVILPATTVTFYEGESVFNLLAREMKRNKIHLEFMNTPLYNSAYIEGIANLYEFDCGELSGWLYRVNDWFPNYGCSRYQLQEGDVVDWVYTCDLGGDVGGFAAAGG